jgi:CubicO group peptidase (beta-lactamase class C family)
MVRNLCYFGHWGCWRLCVVIALGAMLQSKPLPAKERLSEAEFTAKLDQTWTTELQPQLQDAIKRGEMPGGVLCIGRKSGKPWVQVVGHRQLQPKELPMTPGTLYDLASLTKPLVTATLIMKLHEEGKLDIEKPVAKYLPEFAVPGKEQITIKHLLLHTSGLIADNAMADYQAGQPAALEKILALKPIRPVDECFVYSDVGFLVLGQVVERVGGKPLDVAARELLFEPLDMGQTMFNPGKALQETAAPCDKRAEQWLPRHGARPPRGGTQRRGRSCRSIFHGRGPGALCHDGAQ